VDDPYEPPRAAQVIVDTSLSDPQDDGGRIVDYLEVAGFLAPLAAP
jgi:adenylylsulfate kinase-like enzyme